MPGTFTPSQRPRRPGAYTRWAAQEAVFVPPSPGAIVAVPFVNDWGPFEENVSLNSFNDYLDIYGDDPTQPGYIAVKEAFQGEGFDGRGGAGQVVARRFGGSAAAKADADVNNSAATPAAAITVTARYEGSKGNDFSVQVRASATAGHKELVVLDGTETIEVFDHVQTDLASLVADINANSDWLTATLTLDGTALGNGTTALIGGNDGGEIAGADVTAVLDGLGTQRFTLFSFFDLAGADYASGTTVASVQAAIVAWAQDLNSRGKRFLTAFGGALDENAAAANARSDAIDHPDFVNLGVGSVEDEALGVLSTSQLAPRLAGALAFRGETQGATFIRFAGLTLINGATDDELEAAIDHGTMMLASDSDPAAPVRTDQGLTTYTTEVGAQPVDIFSVPKFVRVMHLVEMETTEYFEQEIAGRLQMNEHSRQAVVGHLRDLLGDRQRRGVILPGFTAHAVGEPDDSVNYFDVEYTVTFGRDIERLFQTFRVS